MGKGGVLWGRLAMNKLDQQRVIYRRNRTIYRRQVTNLSPSRSERGLFIWGRIRFSRTQRHHLALTRAYLRKESKLPRTIFASRRGRDGVRTDSVFTIKKNRNRQSGADSPSRSVALTCWNRKASIRFGRGRSSGIVEPRKLECEKGRKSRQTQRHHDACSEKGRCERRENLNTQPLISTVEQGRSAIKVSMLTDDMCALFEIFAASAAQHESRTTHFSESICMDARY